MYTCRRCLKQCTVLCKSQQRHLVSERWQCHSACCWHPPHQPPPPRRGGKIQLEMGATSYAPSHHIRLHALTPERPNSPPRRRPPPQNSPSPTPTDKTTRHKDSTDGDNATYMAHMPRPPPGFAWQLWPAGQLSGPSQAPPPVPPSPIPVNNISIWNTNSGEALPAGSHRAGARQHSSRAERPPPRPRRQGPPFPEPCPTPIRATAAQRAAALAPLAKALRPGIAPLSVASAVTSRSALQEPAPAPAPAPAPVVKEQQTSLTQDVHGPASHPAAHASHEEEEQSAAGQALLQAAATLKSIQMRAAHSGIFSCQHRQGFNEHKVELRTNMSADSLSPATDGQPCRSIHDSPTSAASGLTLDAPPNYGGDAELLLSMAQADSSVLPLSAVSFSSADSSHESEHAASSTASCCESSGTPSPSGDTAETPCPACAWAAAAATQLQALQTQLLQGMDKLAERVARKPCPGGEKHMRKHEQRIRATQTLLDGTRAVALRMEVTRADLLHCARTCSS